MPRRPLSLTAPAALTSPSRQHRPSPLSRYCRSITIVPALSLAVHRRQVAVTPSLTVELTLRHPFLLRHIFHHHQVAIHRCPSSSIVVNPPIVVKSPSPSITDKARI
jgi:hypothetical protein